MCVDPLVDVSEFVQHKNRKHHRAKRIASTQKTKARRMREAELLSYPSYPYYIKSECLIYRYRREFVPTHEEARTRLVFSPKTFEFHEEVIGAKVIPAHYRKRIVHSTVKKIKPYLKQYCRTSCRKEYKHLAVRKERYARYEYAPSARSSYKRVAEVDWLAW